MMVLGSGGQCQFSPRTSRRYIQESASPELDRKGSLHLGQRGGGLTDRGGMCTYRRVYQLPTDAPTAKPCSLADSPRGFVVSVRRNGETARPSRNETWWVRGSRASR